MRDRLLAGQDQHPDGAEFIFDVPIAPAERLTGFRHDSTPPGRGNPPFEVLRSERGG